MMTTIEPLHVSVKAFEKEKVLEAIALCDGNRDQACKCLQISMATLYRKLDDEHRKLSPSQRVYVLFSPVAKAYKIGCSSQPMTREKTFHAYEPDVRLVKEYKGQRIDEQRLHAKFSGKRIRGEWFALTKSDLKTIDDYFTVISELMAHG